jgi:uncharacterized protein YecE (DUF72 family)
MGGQFLSERDEVYGVSFFLRDQIRCGGIGQYVLRDSCPVYGAGLVCKDPARLLITSDFTYVRWLGNRKGIEEKTKTWDKVIVDRQDDLFNWVGLLKKVHERRIQILAFANNHYAGHGPDTVKLFSQLWDARD